jgi:serine/threonine-protein kinase
VIAQDPRPGTDHEVGGDVTLTVSDGPGTRADPDLEGHTRRQARAPLRRAGFRVRERTEASEDVDEGKVLRTSPPVTSQIAVGSTVTLVLSSGPEQVAVPDLVGKDIEDARDQLESAGLTADVRREENEDAEPGTVLRQDPAAGGKIDKGGEIKLVVAEEPESVSVPDVRGRSESEAVAALSSVGLEVNVDERDVNRPSQDGVVQKQSPGRGKRLDRGSSVTITVGRFEPDAGTGDDQPDQPDEGDGDTGGDQTQTQPGTSTGTSTGPAAPSG